MYTLYFDRSEKTIKVSKARKAFQHLKFKKEITRYNEWHFICANRKPLIEKAKEIQQNWISELEEEITAIKEIKL
jgi:hypothetical protein